MEYFSCILWLKLFFFLLYSSFSVEITRVPNPFYSLNLRYSKSVFSWMLLSLLVFLSISSYFINPLIILHSSFILIFSSLSRIYHSSLLDSLTHMVGESIGSPPTKWGGLGGYSLLFYFPFFYGLFYFFFFY